MATPTRADAGGVDASEDDATFDGDEPGPVTATDAGSDAAVDDSALALEGVVEIEKPYLTWARPRPKGEVAAGAHDELVARWNLGGTSDSRLPLQPPGLSPGNSRQSRHTRRRRPFAQERTDRSPHGQTRGGAQRDEPARALPQARILALPPVLRARVPDDRQDQGRSDPAPVLRRPDRPHRWGARGPDQARSGGRRQLLAGADPAVAAAAATPPDRGRAERAGVAGRRAAPLAGPGTE